MLRTTSKSQNVQGCRSARRGNVLIVYALSMVVLLGFVSFAVDFGRVQSIKVDLQRCADATALAAVQAYADNGYTLGAATAAGTAVVAANQVEAGSGVNPTVNFTPGTWNRSTRTFSPTYAPGTPAIRVIVSRNTSTNNPVQLTFGSAIGMPTVDVQASAIATIIESESEPVTLASTANLYLAGMPAGTNSPWGDNDTNATASEISSIPVVPGTWITFTNTAGTTSILPGYLGYYDANGEAARPLHHGQNQDGSDWNIGPENGIGDAIIPGAALTGLFLTDRPPTDFSPPPMVDWTDPAVKEKASYDDIPAQAPFLIGDGMTSGGVVKRFQVPAGATRLYLGTWDGVVQSNNGGTLTATVNLKRSVRLVK